MVMPSSKVCTSGRVKLMPSRLTASHTNVDSSRRASISSIERFGMMELIDTEFIGHDGLPKHLHKSRRSCGLPTLHAHSYHSIDPRTPIDRRSQVPLFYSSRRGLRL